MDEEKIKESIIWYLKIYDGQYSNTKERVIEKIINADGNKREYNYYNSLFIGAFYKLELDKKISLIAFEVLDEQQRFEYENRNELFYKVLEE